MAGSTIGSGSSVQRSVGPLETASGAVESLKETSARAEEAERRVEYLVADMFDAAGKTPLLKNSLRHRRSAIDHAFTHIVEAECPFFRWQASVSARFDLANDAPVLTLRRQCRRILFQSPRSDVYLSTSLTKQEAIAEVKNNPDFLAVLTAAARSAEADMQELSAIGDGKSH